MTAGRLDVVDEDLHAADGARGTSLARTVPRELPRCADGDRLPHNRGREGCPESLNARDFPGANARSGPTRSRRARFPAPPCPAGRTDPVGRDEADRERGPPFPPGRPPSPARSMTPVTTLGSPRARETRGKRSVTNVCAAAGASRATVPRRARYARRGGPDAGRDGRRRGGRAGSGNAACSRWPSISTTSSPHGQLVVPRASGKPAWSAGQSDGEPRTIVRTTPTGAAFAARVTWACAAARNRPICASSKEEQWKASGASA
jgi:hypothetical protein